jgi:hypothetical protein
VLRAGKAELPHIWGWVSPEEARSVKQTNPEMSATPYVVIAQGAVRRPPAVREGLPPSRRLRHRHAALYTWLDK